MKKLTAEHLGDAEIRTIAFPGVSEKENADPNEPRPADCWDERLRLSTDPNSPLFESFRRLRLPILHTMQGRKTRTILVTSTIPQEGKSFVCANLGISLSQDLEHHALMVDCDLRKPTLSRLFGIANQNGLIDHLKENVDLFQFIKKTGQAKLSLISSGSPVRNPSELLMSARMVSLIEELVSRYDDRIILFDSPPHVVASETVFLASHMDGVILVVRHGGSSKVQVKKFVDAIGTEKILSVIFNACPENMVTSFLNRKFGYGYYGYSAY